MKEKEVNELLTLKELSDDLDNAFFDWDVDNHIEKLRSLLSVKHKVDFSKEYFINFNFDLSSAELREYYYSQFYIHYCNRFYDSVIKDNSQNEVNELINQIIEYRNENKY